MLVIFDKKLSKREPTVLLAEEQVAISRWMLLKSCLMHEMNTQRSLALFEDDLRSSLNTGVEKVDLRIGVRLATLSVGHEAVIAWGAAHQLLDSKTQVTGTFVVALGPLLMQLHRRVLPFPFPVEFEGSGRSAVICPPSADSITWPRPAHVRLEELADFVREVQPGFDHGSCCIPKSEDLLCRICEQTHWPI